jgi:hypothetical protein
LCARECKISDVKTGAALTLGWFDGLNKCDKCFYTSVKLLEDLVQKMQREFTN